MARMERCQFCKAPIEQGQCEFATYKKTVDGKEYFFCCRSCAQKSDQQMESVQVDLDRLAPV